MKIRTALLLVFSLCILSGCGEEISEEVYGEIVVIDTTADMTEETDTVTEISSDTETSAATETSEETTTTTASPAEPPEDLIMTGLETVEVYSEITVGDLITDTNMELKEESILIDTSELGEFEAEIPYIYDGNEFTANVKYTVVDTTDPIILNGGWTVYHETGTPFDLNEYVGFADNYDKAPVLTYTGEVDPNTAGSYYLTAIVTDSSGNSIDWELTVKVTDNIPGWDDNNTRVNYSDFIAKYEGENVRFGIDVSAWQGDIDFNAVKEAGCNFVIMRMGRCYGTAEMDNYFTANIEGATAAGLDVGVYFYSTDNTVEGILEDTAWIAEHLNGRELDFPVVFDWEDFGTFQEYGMSIHDLNSLFELFADEMERYGYSAMLYSSKNFLNTFWSERIKNDYPVWLAHYTSSTDYDGEYAIWQASAYGRIPGIYGDVDMDILYTDRAEH